MSSTWTYVSLRQASDVHTQLRPTAYKCRDKLHYNTVQQQCKLANKLTVS